MIHVVGKFIDWLLPERALRRYVLEEVKDELKRQQTRYDQLEQRLNLLEARYASDCCFRTNCRYRINQFQIDDKT